MDNIKFKGIMPALITPFDENGNIYTDTVAELVHYHLNAGVNGFYVCGATGEGPALSKRSRMEMTETVIDANKKQGRVIVHVGSINAEETIALTRHATKAGADGISSVPPLYFYKYTQKEIMEYYKKIADNTDLPILLYATNNMAPTKMNSIISELIEIENIVGIKDTRCDYYEMWKAKQIKDGDVNVINGPDEMLICGLITGADGGIGSTYNIMPEKFIGLYNAFKDGKVDEAKKFQSDINNIIMVLHKYGGNGVIKPIKYLLELRGYKIGNAVFPSMGYAEEDIVSFKEDIKRAGLDI